VCSSLSATDQVSHPYNTTGSILVSIHTTYTAQETLCTRGCHPIASSDTQNWNGSISLQRMKTEQCETFNFEDFRDI
jgi:hypothetical protein